MTKTGYTHIPTGEEPVAVAIMDDVTPTTSSATPAPTAPSAGAGPVMADTTVIAPPTTIRSSTTAITTTSMLGRRPCHMDVCPHCGAQNIRTRTQTYPSCLTWVATGITFMLFWPLFWIPLCMDSCKQTDHFCQQCHANVGTLKALEDCCVTEMH
mmetsp:Transcript_18344/g.28328  ORF Transcript_18344/g.28328 Transcript_18344/m.28328 type:complete len:155 (-) Transcript_18344:184-648(-)